MIFELVLGYWQDRTASIPARTSLADTDVADKDVADRDVRVTTG